MIKNQGQNAPKISDSRIIHGGCHCGAVKFTAQVDQSATVLACNCSICAMTGFKHLMVPHPDFELTTDESALSLYQFNTHQAKHLFCRHCGIKSFYQPRSHPDSWSINAHCIDGYDPSQWQHADFDGQNWEDAQQTLQRAD